MQIYGGSNSHVLTDIENFLQYKEGPIKIQQLSGTTSSARGYGIEVIRIPKTDMIIPLWPVYHMPENPQNTLSQNALKDYNKFRSVRTEALQWIKFTNHLGNTSRLHTNTYLQIGRAHV